MASEALPFSPAVAARELEASKREVARQQQVQAAVIQEETEIAELESLEAAEAARHKLAAEQLAARRAKGDGGSSSGGLGEITDTVGEISDVITAAVEIETIIVPLILLANYHVRFLSGNLGVLPEAGGPLSSFLDKCMEVSSAGAKTVGKTAAGTGSGAGAQFDVKKLALWQIFLGVIIDILLALSIMVSFLIMIAVPLIVAGGIAGTIYGFCSTYPDVCTSMESTFTDIVSFFTS